MEPILLSEGLRKSFGKKEVLKGVDFRIFPGEVCALLGKNGAGKTTFINTTIGLSFPTGGSVLVYGEKPGMNNSRIGYLSENITLYPHLSARDNLKVASYSSNCEIDSKKIDSILERINLQDTGKKPTKSFSLGMKRRLQLAMSSMVKKVDFLILDEPTNGLDINGMIWLKQYLKELSDSGVSILMASHAIADLQDCITNYVVLDDGVIAKQGVWTKDKEKSTGFVIEVDPDVLPKLKEAIKDDFETLSDNQDTAVFWKTGKTYKEVCEHLKAESIKIFKSWFFWIMVGVHVLLYLALFYQYTLNTGSNVIEPLLKKSDNLYSFFIIFFSAIFNTVFAVVLGSQVISRELSGNTTGYMIHSSGRYKPFIAKICILFISSFLMILILFLLGILLPLIFWKAPGHWHWMKSS